MGARNSHLGPRAPLARPIHHHRRRRRPPKRSLSSFFICGGSSFSSTSEIDDDKAELLVNSAELGNLNKPQPPRNDHLVPICTGSGLTTPKSGTRVSSDRIIVANNTCQLGDGSGGGGASHGETYLSESREMLSPRLSISDYCSGEIATSYRVDKPSVEKNVSSGLAHCGSPSLNELDESSSDRSLKGNHVAEEMASSNYNSSTASVVSDSPSNNHLPRDDTVYEAGLPGSGMLVSEREQNRSDGNAFHVNMVTVPSSVVSSSSSEVNSEARRNGRRVFWDAVPGCPQRYIDSRTYLFPNDDDHRGDHDRWLDFSDDFLGEGVGGDFRSYGSGPQGNYEHSRSEIFERFNGGHDGNGPQTALCSMGIHPEGACLCRSILRAESGFRASISRIVLLAEALFEVLDEMQRQPLSVSFPVVSLPASEAVVNAFPVKNYRKPEKSESSDHVAKCYICLAEYEEGDKIRVLPCHHEYHVSCIDKWLKEIHGVCPLCRGDVCEGFTKDSASTL